MPILQCQGLTKYYGGVLALDHADIAIEPGQIVGLLGPNGSGKRLSSSWRTAFCSRRPAAF